METLEFTVTIVINFVLKIIGLNPATDIGDNWKFDDPVYGPSDNDGVTAFRDAVVKAAALPKDQGRKLLFADGLADGQDVNTGDSRLTVLANRKLADPDLGWSLYNEEGQKTLRYLYDTYDVEWMEFLRRILCSPRGNRNSLYLCRKVDGSWSWDGRWLGVDRNAEGPALVLGE